ncbi:MAG: MFS transporter [Bacillota bacterium]
METKKLSYSKTFLLGFGFFCISLVWPLYNNFVPIFLSKYISSTFLIGVIMTFDNIAAVTLQPIIGGLSDRTNSRYGKRMPYLLFGIPLSGLFFTMIPFEFSLISLMAFAMLFNIAMSIYRAPTVALMPDLTPAEHRSKANGIINFMGGVGTAIALSAGSLIYDVDKRLPFFGTAIIMLIALAILFKTIKEPRAEIREEKDKETGIVAAFGEVFRDKDKSALLLLFAIFFWFVGYQGIEALFSLYVVKFLGYTESAAGFTLFFFSAAFIAFSIPSGYLATAIGRRKTIKLGIIGLMIVFIGVVFVKSLLILRVLMAVGGVFWACININSYPMVVQMTTDNKIGAYTGLYYFFSSMAAIVGPPLFGAFIDVVGFGVMFIVALCFLLLALLSMTGVKKGEAVKNS